MRLLTFVVSSVFLCSPLGCSSTSDTSTPDGSGTSSSSAMTASCEPAASPEGSAVDEYFPDIKLTGCDGEKVTLDALRCEHELTWVSVGAAWCGPCQEEAPELEAAFVAHGDDGVGVVQILFQGPSSAPATTLDCANWTQQYALTLPVYVDPVGNSLVGFDGGAAQTPLNIVLDRDGKVLWSHTGALEEGGVDATLQSLR